MKFEIYETDDEKNKEMKENTREILNDIKNLLYNTEFSEIDLLIRDLIKWREE